MIRLIRCLVMVAVTMSSATFAQPTPPDYVTSAVPNATRVGSGMFTYYFWDVYEATLFAPNGSWEPTAPFALQLTYQRDLKGKKIAQRSVDEIRKQGFDDAKRLETWMTKMTQIFPDVSDGDTLTGIATKDSASVFYFNGKQVGVIEDPRFTVQFFNIWLSEKTSEPEFRQALLNQ